MHMHAWAWGRKAVGGLAFLTHTFPKRMQRLHGVPPSHAVLAWWHAMQARLHAPE